MNDRPATILVIDDDEFVRQSFTACLEDAGYTVVEAENGLTGMHRFREARPDLVMVDLRMPVMGGYEVIEKLQEESPNMPLIVVSGAGVLSDVVEAIRKGAWDYMVKPVSDMDALLHCVRRNLERADLLQQREAYQEHLEREVENRTRELAEVNRRLEATNERLRGIVESTLMLSTLKGFHRLCAKLLEEFGRLMGADGASLYLVEKNRLNLACSLDPGHAPCRLGIPVREKTLFHHVLSAGKPLLADEVSPKRGFTPSGWDGYRGRSALVFPLLDRGRSTVGLVSLHNKRNGEFTELDREMGSVLASYASEALRAAKSADDLRASEEKYRDLVNNLTDVIFTMNEKGELLYVSPAVTTLLGYLPEEVIGAPFLDFVYEEDVPRVLDRFREILDNSPFFPSEYRVLASDGTVRWVRSATRPKLYEDGRREFQGLLSDITELKRRREEQDQLEVQLRQAQKMEAIGTLAGGIAHDFNNILTPIIVFTEMSRQLVVKDSPAEKQLNEVLVAAKRAKELVSQILTFSRQTEAEKRPVHAEVILREAMKLLRSSIPSSIRFDQHIAAECPPVLGDPTQIHQVLMNLCTNAYHAMAESGGIMRVEYGEMEVPEHAPKPGLAPGKYARLAVSDTGKGMDVATLEKIFEPYFTTKEQDKGTGLGLAVVHGIVAGMGGEIFVTSSPGEGTLFEVVIPVIEPPPDTKSAMDGEQLPTGTERILFVDDEPTIASMGKPMLEHLGYSAVVENDSRRALDLIRDDPGAFDLVLSDVTMPHMNGDTLAKRILEIRPDMPVVLCTGFSGVFDGERAEEIGVAGFIYKPLVLEQVAETVRKVLDEAASRGRTRQ
ncbi:MAG: response regulator [Desulfatibacillaceae bacterium]